MRTPRLPTRRRPTRRLPPAAALAALALAAAGLLAPGRSVGAARAPLAPPAQVDPGPPGGPPSDAIVVFDGKDLSRFAVKDPAKTWNVQDGLLTVRPGAGDLHTKDAFGDIQLHMEWRIPADVKGSGESRGNSGIKLHEAYEVQILDSHGATESVDRISGAVYKQHPPLVNAARKAGEWQSYDIVFRAPRFDAAGKLARSGTLTVFHNGVLVQDRAKILGRTNSSRPVSPEYRQPFFLQDHGAAISFRNIWVRELAPLEEDG